jgi:predicted ester cyclase
MQCFDQLERLSRCCDDKLTSIARTRIAESVDQAGGSEHTRTRRRSDPLLVDVATRLGNATHTFSNVKGEGFAVKHRLYGENFVVDDKIWTARVDGELLGLPGHGRRIHVRVLHVFEFRDGLICRENVWLDGAAVSAQLTGNGMLASDPTRET